MPPPQLSGNAPVLDVLHPVVIDLREAFGNEFDLVFHHRVDGGLCERLHFHKPLFGNDGFHGRMAAVAMPHVVGVRLYFHQEALFLKIRDDFLSRLVPVQPRIGTRPLVHGAVVVHHADDFEGMSFAHFEVVRVVRGRDFHAARTEFHVHILVRDDGYFPVRQGEFQRLADKTGIPFVVGVYRHGGIPEHRFRSGGGHHHIPLAVRGGIAKVPEGPRFFGVFHFRVGERGLAAGAPVDDAVPLIDESFVVKIDKHFPNGAGTFFVHREGLAGPIARSAQFSLL